MSERLRKQVELWHLLLALAFMIVPVIGSAAFLIADLKNTDKEHGDGIVQIDGKIDKHERAQEAWQDTFDRRFRRIDRNLIRLGTKTGVQMEAGD